MKPYQEEYEAFVANLRAGEISAEEVGIVISRMAQYFGETNNVLAVCAEARNKKAAEIVSSEDPITGKPIAVSKAEIMIDDTEEARLYNRSKTDIQNIEQYINALKALQRGVLNEYSHMGSN